MYFICLSGGVGFDECRPQGLAQSTKMSWRQFCAFLIAAAAAYSIMATEGNTTDTYIQNGMGKQISLLGQVR